MPAYRTHVSVNLLLSLPLSIAALKYTLKLSPEDFVSFAGAFIYGTFFLHPDLDLAKNIRLFSFKGLMTLPFRPLSYFMKHRGISHAPIFGTLIRVLWLMIFLSIIMSLLDWSYPQITNIWSYSVLWLALCGLATADISHIILDKYKKVI